MALHALNLDILFDWPTTSARQFPNLNVAQRALISDIHILKPASHEDSLHCEIA